MPMHGKAGADTGFPVGGGANPLGAPTYDFANFSKKLHEVENILGRRGAAPGAPPLDPPLKRVQITISKIMINELTKRAKPNKEKQDQIA